MLIFNRIKFILFVLLLLSVFEIFVDCEIINNSSRSFNAKQKKLIADAGYRRHQIFNPFNFNPRQSRFLSLFTYIQFNNVECRGATGENGTCVAGPECVQRGGTPNGPCAAGYGICCLFLVSCGATIRENGTYFVPNSYPNQYDTTGSCQVTLLKSNADICQYRLDFNQFVIMGPETVNHICNNDQFIVSGGGNPVPILCGNNIGNHLYIDAGAGVTNPVTLSIVTNGVSFQRNWKIKISQIPCSSTHRADDGCLQYFTGVAGQIRSFNYDPITGLQLSNQDYSICIRNERNFCSIQYSQCEDPVHNRSLSFTLTGNSNNAITAAVGSGGGSNSCQTDYLIIPMVSNVGRSQTSAVASVDRICGGVLAADVTLRSTPIRSKLNGFKGRLCNHSIPPDDPAENHLLAKSNDCIVKPFRLWFHSDSVEAPVDIDNRGFCLNYVQQPCTNTLS